MDSTFYFKEKKISSQNIKLMYFGLGNHGFQNKFTITLI